jgi:hypothetical protein
LEVSAAFWNGAGAQSVSFVEALFAGALIVEALLAGAQAPLILQSSSLLR